MAATAEQIIRLRRMAGEENSNDYSDALLAGFIERYPLVDALGNDPWEVDTTTDPVSVTTNDEWSATYDLNAAAADVWSEKAGGLAGNFDFSAGGQTFNRSQAYEMYMKQSRYYRARRAVKTIRQQPVPKMETEDGV